MALDLIADKNLLILSINNFSKKYHIDFFTTKNLSENYLRHINEPSALALAENFGRTLCAWGAGRRKAPKIKSYLEITSALLDIIVIETIKFFSGIRITDFKIIGGAPQFGNTAISIEDFRKRALNSLILFSEKFFIGNTGITYPMKSLLLLTGFMPAWDSQVRKGLSLSGFHGTNAHLLLPDQDDSTAFQKISSLPFYLGDCYTKNKDTFDTAIRESNYPELISDPGRLFDILFFMQGSKQHRIFSCSGVSTRWYRIFN